MKTREGQLGLRRLCGDFDDKQLLAQLQELGAHDAVRELQEQQQIVRRINRELIVENPELFDVDAKDSGAVDRKADEITRDDLSSRLSALLINTRHERGYIFFANRWVHKTFIYFCLYSCGLVPLVPLSLFLILSPFRWGFSVGCLGLVTCLVAGVLLWFKTKVK
jgi:hypothetical protein